ncbi:MAG: hypothetical protein N2112_02490 [Gemmataceae bacterium]|nr:hypothetical protein [Gemmataceae bacterium]
MPSFLTDAELKTSLAATLKVDESSLAAYWDTLITECNQAAYLDVRGGIIQRGFSSAQADAWDRGKEFQRDIGLYWLLVKGAGLHEYDQKFIMLLDRREELKSVLIELAGGANQTPAGDPSTSIFNRLDTTNDRWTLETPL